MLFEIGYQTKYDYPHDSMGQSSMRTMSDERKFLPWDGKQSFEDIIFPKERKFVKGASRISEDTNHRIVVDQIRIGAEGSSVVMTIEPQEIKIPTK